MEGGRPAGGVWSKPAPGEVYIYIRDLFKVRTFLVFLKIGFPGFPISQKRSVHFAIELTRLSDSNSSRGDNLGGFWVRNGRRGAVEAG